MGLDPKIWLPHFQFVMQTMAISYPKRPNDVSKKKYYDFIQNLPVFLPDEPMGNHFLKLFFFLYYWHIVSILYVKKNLKHKQNY